MSQLDVILVSLIITFLLTVGVVRLQGSVATAHPLPPQPPEH